MSIEFTCPYCTKTLKVADDLGGKKGKCPSCLKPVVIPKPGSNGATKASLKPPAPRSLTKAANGQGAKAVPKKKPVVDAESIAAEAFSEPKGEEVVVTQFKFKCDFCEEEVEVNADLCGKQSQCPACRRIIKVPLQKKAEAKDWRKVDALPSGARRDVGEAPEGAWGSTSLGRVSVDSLEEAGVIKEKKIPLAPRQKVARGLTIAVLVFVAIGLSWWGMVSWGQSRFERARRDAEAFLPQATPDPNKPQIKGPAAAEVYRVLGLIETRDQDAVKANKMFSEARRQLQFLATAGEELTDQDRDALFVVLSLARVQVDLGADNPFASRHVTWPDAQKYVQQTLGLLGTAQTGRARADAFADARAAAIDEIGTAFLKIKPDFAPSILAPMGTSPNDPELGALFGLLLVRNGDKAKALAKAEELFKDHTGKSAKDKTPAAPMLVALLLAVNKDADAESLIPKPEEGDPLMDGRARLAYALGYAYQDKWPKAISIATTRGKEHERFAAIFAVAQLAATKMEGELPQYLEAALDAFTASQANTPVSSFKQRDLMRLGIKAKLSQDKLKPLTDPWARLELVRARLDEGKQAEESWAEAIEDKNSLPYGLALEMIATQRAKQGSSLQAQIGSWNPSWVRPLGYVGTALGLHVPVE